MNTNLRVMLEFVQQLRTVHDSHELAKSEENIRQLIEEGFILQSYGYVQMLTDVVSEIEIEISYTKDLVDKLEQKCNEMKKAIGHLSSTGEYHENSDGEVEHRKPLHEMEPLQHLHVKAETRREEEELKRKISSLNEEIRKLEEDITEIEGQILFLIEIIERFLEQERISPPLCAAFLAGGFGIIAIGPAGVLAGLVFGVAAGILLSASAGVDSDDAIRVLGIDIDTSTKDSCIEGIQRLQKEIHDRRQRISYLAGEIAKQERVLFNM